MADYVSTLTGSQMDAALLDMAEHNSEAYAVGERNGIDVPPDDVTYHNNARYYAQQAQSIAPASVTEAVRWDIAQTALTDANKEQARENINAADNDTSVQVVTQTFTSAQQEIARANIAAGSTNPNLLDNPWFTINQRDVAVGVVVNASNYIADRWIATGTLGAQRNADGSITNNATVYQKLSSTIPVGANITFSALLADGTVEAWTSVFDGASTKVMDLPSFGTSRFYMAANPPQINVGACATAIKAFKLELGTVSTLANDVPPDYASELTKCKYYFNRVYSGAVMGSGWATSATNAIILLPVPQMRTTPTLSVTSVGTFRMKGAGGISVVPSAITINSASQVGVCVNVTISGATTHDLYCLSGTDATAYINLSADL